MSSTTALAQKKKKIEEKTSEQLTEAEFQFTEVMKFIITEEYEKAIPFFQKALDILPDNAGVQYSMAQAYDKLNQPEKAIPYAEKAFQLDATNKYYALLLADLQVKQKKYAEAEKIYKNLMEQEPSSSDYGIELAAIYLLQNKYDDALKAYDKVERNLGVTEEITRQKQIIYLRENKINEAIKEAQKLVASEPEETDYQIELVQLLMTNERTDEAQPYLEKILKTNPDDPQAHVLLAEVYRKKGDAVNCNKQLDLAFNNANLDGLTKARILASYLAMLSDESSRENAFRLAQGLVKMHPQESKVHVIYGDLLMQRNQKVQARDSYVKGAHLDRSTFEVWARIVQLDTDLQQLDSLIAHTEEAIEVFPNQPMLWYSNGSAYLIKRNYEKSIESLEEARRLNSNKEMETIIYGQLGDAYNGVGKNEKSDNAYESALKADPTNDHVLNNYSYFLSLRKEKLPLALEMGNKLVELHPNNGTYLDTYAWVLYVNKDYEKAKTYLEKAVANNGNSSATIIEHYGDVLYQLGEKEKALEQWKKAKAMGQANNPQLDKKIATGQLYE